MSKDFEVEVRYYKLPPRIQPYFTGLYATTIECPEDQWILDCLHPEWAAMRFTQGPPPKGAVGDAELTDQWPFVANGPTSRSIRFEVTRSRIWGLGLQPVGWAKFIRTPACKLINRTVDGMTDQAFQIFRPVNSIVQGGRGSADPTAAQIVRFLMEHADRHVPRESKILACQAALSDATVSSIEQLCDRLAMSRRSLERFCNSYFGFPPRMLLRRQRFLRSLARFMQDGPRKWTDAMDGQYYDSAQFWRDFKIFMGMTPGQYADAPHPLLEKVIGHRIGEQGAAPRTDLPMVLRYTAMPRIPG